jgi:uncharacterized membrane protein YhdT
MEEKILRRLKVNSIMAIIWYVLSIAAYLSLTFIPEEVLHNLLPDEQQMVFTLPKWFYVSCSVTVFAGLIGSLALFFRKKISMFFTF